MPCKICNSKVESAFTATVLGKNTANFYCCTNCGYLFASEPHWLDEAYSSAIAAADTGLVSRNIMIADKVASILYWIDGSCGRGRYLDAAGGYGMLTRMMRDMGFDFYWSDKHCQNLLADRFEYFPELGACDVVTAMEVMEHLVDPLDFVSSTLRSAQSETLIFTTELYEGAVPKPEDWWYYTFATGQHIGFFKKQTFEVMAKKLNMHFYSANGMHMLSRNTINCHLFKCVTGRWSAPVGAKWARWHLGSKTLSDHEAILNEVKST